MANVPMYIYVVYYVFEVDKVFLSEERAREYVEEERLAASEWARPDCWEVCAYEVEDGEGHER